MKLSLPQEVNKAIKMLTDNGFEAFAVGGCIRDLIMGRTPYDFDITTNALPEQTQMIFENFKIIETGIKHGTVTVIINSLHLEITTYRIDGEYNDNRHPENVTFSRSLKDDLSRRDFTVNTLCYNEKEGLIDLFCGVDDIKRKIIRCVGEPDKRFNEDALRILRAIRFAGVLNFTIESETSQSIIKNRELLKNIAYERIRDEFTKLICGENAVEIIKNYHSVIEVFVPELTPLIGCEQNTPYHIYDVFNHSIIAMGNIENDEILRLTMFFHDFGKPDKKSTDINGVDHFKGHAPRGAEIVKPILKRLHYDNKTIMLVTFLVLNHNKKSSVTKTEAKYLLNEVGEENYIRIIKIKRADTSAKAKPHAIDEKLNNMQLFLEEIKENNECFDFCQLAINGTDLINAGITDGIEIKNCLSTVLNEIIEDKLENNRQSILEFVKQTQLKK